VKSVIVINVYNLDTLVSIGNKGVIFGGQGER